MGDLNSSDSKYLVNHYHENFNSDEYKKAMYTKIDGGPEFLMTSYVQALRDYGKDNSGKLKKMIDFGCGPIPFYSCTAIAAGINVQLTMSDLVLQNIDFLRKWKKNYEDNSSFFPYFNFLANLSNKNLDEVLKRTREAMVNFESLDVTADLSPHYGRYDLLISNLCLETASTTLEKYRENVEKFVKLVSVGGHIMMGVSLKLTEYQLRETTFKCISLSEDDIKSAVSDAGCQIMVAKARIRKQDEKKPSNHLGVLFICGRRIR